MASLVFSGKPFDIKDVGLLLFADQAGPDVIPSHWQDDEQYAEDHHNGLAEVGYEDKALLVQQILRLEEAMIRRH